MHDVCLWAAFWFSRKSAKPETVESYTESPTFSRHLCFWSHIASLSGFPSFMEQHWLPIKYFQLHILKLHSIPVNTWHISKTENNLPNSIWVWERDYSALKQSTRANGESEHRPLISFWLEVIITLLTDGNLVHEEFMCREKSCEMQLTERY